MKLEKIDSAFAIEIDRQYVAAVDLLDEKRSVFEKSDWPYYALGVQILKVKKTQKVFNEY